MMAVTCDSRITQGQPPHKTAQNNRRTPYAVTEGQSRQAEPHGLKNESGCPGKKKNQENYAVHNLPLLIRETIYICYLTVDKKQTGTKRWK
jgi:hypothetical protein